MPIRKGDIHKLEEMPWPEVRDHVLDLARSLDALLAAIQGRAERNDRNLGLFNLGFRAVHELHRVAEHLEGNVEETRLECSQSSRNRPDTPVRTAKR